MPVTPTTREKWSRDARSVQAVIGNLRVMVIPVTPSLVVRLDTPGTLDTAFVTTVITVECSIQTMK